MNILKTVIKILVLLSAAGVALLRFISFKYEASFSAQTLHGMFIASIVCAAVLLLSGILWVFLEKRSGAR